VVGFLNQLQQPAEKFSASPYHFNAVPAGIAHMDQFFYPAHQVNSVGLSAIAKLRMSSIT